MSEIRQWIMLVEAADHPDTYWKPETIAWWQRRSPPFKTEADARTWMFNQLQWADKQSHAHLFGINGPAINQQLADKMPLYRVRGGVMIGVKPRVSRARMPMIGTEQPEGSAPDVDWHSQDLQDGNRYVTAETIARDYVWEPDRRRVTVYPAYVPQGDIPREVCAEEECDDDEDGGGSYDWDQFRHRGEPPPMKLLVRPNGKIEIMDGNHRLRWWRERGYDDIPAWVIDYRRVKPRD